MIDPKMREEFEDWFNETWPEPEMAAHEHKEAIKLAWNASWRASRDAVEVELPQGGYWAGYDNEHMMESRDVREALEAAGLKVKQ